jgi:NADPH:quinone reductase-like Zn-dependent oxidoreductase
LKAIAFSRYGSADQLELTDVPKPIPQGDEVCIEVHASSINSWDWEFLNGKPLVNRLFYGWLKPQSSKQILGADVCGVVVQVGPSVSKFKVGDEVFGDLWDHWGGFAEYVCASETALELKPKNLSFVQAACIPQAGVLALQGMRRGEPLQAGDKVLINGAGGGVGTFAIQLAKQLGAQVTGVDASHKLDIVRQLGADYVMDYQTEDFTQTGQCYDLIVDCQNFRSMLDNRRALAANGIYAMIGGSIPRVYQLWLLSLFKHDSKTLCLVADGPNKGLVELRDYCDSGTLTPVVDEVFTLEDVPNAMHYFGEGRHRGKIAIRVRE